MSVIIETTLQLDISCKHPKTRNDAAADSTPQLYVYEANTTTAIQVIDGQARADLTGVYFFTVNVTTANGYEVGKTYNCVAHATVAGVTQSKVISTWVVHDEVSEGIYGVPPSGLDLTRVDLSNLALALVGEPPITSLDDATVPARTCKAFFDVARDAALRDGAWNFALSRASLALLGTSPAYEYDNAFQLPSACLRVLDADIREDGYEYTIEGRKLLTNATEVNIKYIERVAEGYFDPMFNTAFVHLLASFIAYPITKDHNRSKELLESYFALKASANAATVVEKQSDVPGYDDLVTVRN